MFTIRVEKAINNFVCSIKFYHSTFISEPQKIFLRFKRDLMNIW